MSSQRQRLILFTRFPLAGKVKTRLIPALGAEGAVALHRRLVLRTLRTAKAACRAANAELEIRFDGGSENAVQHWLGAGWTCRPQGEGDLGQRMARAFKDSFHDGSPATLIIGSDCPELTADLLVAAFDQLPDAPAVFGPANDGGYYLIGLARFMPELFHGITWGGETVLAESLRVLERNGVKPALLKPLNDIDRAEDLPQWRRIAKMEEGDVSNVSVIIPAWNEAERITAAIRAAHEGRPHEIIVADGGSRDDTVRIAQSHGATLVSSPPNRARQMNGGAAVARGGTLLFLHADTLLPANYRDAVLAALRRPEVVGGAFRFRIADPFPGRWLVESTTNLRSRLWQMPYGDQALFVRRCAFEELGGFPELPIMEDYEFVRRLRRLGRVALLNEAVLTSGRRWRRLGFLRTTLINKLVIVGYHCGVPPAKLAALYRGRRPRLRTDEAASANSSHGVGTCLVASEGSEHVDPMKSL